MTLQEINYMEQQQFVETLGWIFENSPWVAERSWKSRPFQSKEALHSALVHCVDVASTSEQLALIGAHPDLGAKAAMSDASVGEQAGAGLNQLSAAEFETLHRLNSAYKNKFNFPFIYAVKGATKREILQALEKRLSNDKDSEWSTALRQIVRIAWFRLSEEIQ